MGKYVLANLLILLLNLGAALTILACNCPIPTPPKVKPPYPPKVKPPTVPKPPVVKPPSPPKVKPTPPTVPKPPVVKPPKPPVVKPPSPPTVKPTPPTVPKPPVVKPPSPKPTPPTVPQPPVVEPPVEPTPPAVPKPSPAPPTEQTCSIDILKLSACVDLLGGLVNIGIGSGAKETCCPVLQGLVDLDAAICLCTTIKAKLLNINIVIPIALQVLIDCGKTPPEGFKCPT